MRLAVLFLVALTFATSAVAQMAYRYVFPDGRVVYSDRPVPGARAESVVVPPPPAAEQPAVPGARWPPPPEASPSSRTQEAAAAPPAAATAPPPAESRPQQQARPPAEQAIQDRIAKLAMADTEVRAAERALAAASASLDAGQEPLPGERTGLARGGSRLNEAYWERQESLKKAVADAQARLDRAVAERNALR